MTHWFNANRLSSFSLPLPRHQIHLPRPPKNGVSPPLPPPVQVQCPFLLLAASVRPPQPPPPPPLNLRWRKRSLDVRISLGQSNGLFPLYTYYLSARLTLKNPQSELVSKRYFYLAWTEAAQEHVCI